MNIQNIQANNNYLLSIQHPNNNLSFKSASDISLKYVYDYHAKYLPKRVLHVIEQLLSSGMQQLPSLYNLHALVYKDLFNAESLAEVKKLFPEFKEVKDIATISSSRSKAISAIKSRMPLEKFTLDYLKKLYLPTSQDDLVKEYGLTNRSLLAWLNDKLQIQKLDGTYIKLMQMSDETQNQRIAELSRKAIYANAEAQKFRLLKAAEAHRTPEYRTKKKKEMKEFYKRTPGAAQRTSYISKETWNRCPEIKEAMRKYYISISKSGKIDIIKLLDLYTKNAPLTKEEIFYIKRCRKGFWIKYPEYKDIYRQRRLEVIEDMKKAGEVFKS